MKHEERRIIKHTPSNLFNLVADVKKYPEFLPWCLGARIKNVSLKSFDAENVVQMEAWGWASPEYSLQDITDKKITKVEIDPSKTLADVNQIDNSFTIE